MTTHSAFLLALLWPMLSWAEHTDPLAWMAGITGRGGVGCCSVQDCIAQDVTLLDQGDTESTVMLSDASGREVVLTLPNSWIHPSQGQTGYWCFTPPSIMGPGPAGYTDLEGRFHAKPPEVPARDNTRCVFTLDRN